MKKFRIDFNSPVILGMTVISFAILMVNMVTGGLINRMLAIYFTSWIDPFMYLRLLTHVLAHQDLSHFAGNFLLILAVGPMVEEKYGSGPLALMMILTAIVTGLINILFFKNILLLGASGLVFMLILLASFTNIREGKIPLTVIMVGVLYIGNEIVSGFISTDNISHLSHTAGGFCGALFGFDFHGDKFRSKK